MFISFEGIDGSGKSTQIQFLAVSLEARGHVVRCVREPGGTELGESIRALLLDPDSAVSPKAELLLFSSARVQLVEQVINPAIARGEIVIADRFLDSTTAYQGGGRGVAPQDFLSELNAFVVEHRLPDCTYLLHIDPHVAAARAGKRGSKDRIEHSGIEFYKRVAACYEALADSNPNRIKKFDATRKPTDLAKAILADAVQRII